jgi:hypothetical protein
VPVIAGKEVVNGRQGIPHDRRVVSHPRRHGSGGSRGSGRAIVRRGFAAERGRPDHGGGFDVAADGSVLQTGSYPTGGAGRGTLSPQPLAVDASGRFLFVSNNDSATLSTLAIGPGGSLSPVPTSPLALGSPSESIATHPTRPWLYVPEFFGTLQVCRITDSGALQRLQTLTPPRPLRASSCIRPGGSPT